MCVAGEPEDVDRLLWCSPPASSAATLSDDGPSYEFEFADQSLPDVYKLRADDGAGADADADAAATDDWVLFADVSAALSVKTVDALVKLLDDKDAVATVSAERFRERAVPRKTLGRQPAVVAAGGSKSSAAKATSKSACAANNSKSVAAANKSAVGDDKPSAAAVQQLSSATKDAAAGDGDAATENATDGEQMVLVRYDRKLKQLLGVDAYTVS